MLTDKEIIKKSRLIKDINDAFEYGVLEHLKNEKIGNLYILSDFYFLCTELLKIDDSPQSYKQTKKVIQKKLLMMKNKGLIDSRRIGTGFMGKTDWGMTSLNNYSLPNFWRN